MFSQLMYLKKMYDHMRSGKSELTIEGLVEDLFERIMGDSKRTAKRISEVEGKVRTLFEIQENIFTSNFIETGDDVNMKRRGESLFEEIDIKRKIDMTYEGMKQLTPWERATIGGYFFEEKNHTEIGKELGFSRETVRNYKNRALDKLRERFISLT